MKSRIKPPIESPDMPYACHNRKASEEARELTVPQYKTALTPPSWPGEMAPDTAAERKLARAEDLLEEVDRREQMLATQIKAHQHCAAQLAEDRALLEAERVNHAKKVRLTEEALNRMREQLALESQTLDEKSRSHQTGADHKDDHIAERAASQDPQGGEGLKRVVNPASDAAPLLSRLAKQAADFAALADTVTELQRLLAEERAEHEVMARSQMDELHKRQEALAQRESEMDKRINVLNADRQSLARAQEEFATARRETAEWQLKRETIETDLAEREKALALNTEKLEAREMALKEEGLAFDERQRKIRAALSSLME
jgi:hypothetical protein